MKASDVIAVATKEIGYLGKKSNAMLDDQLANTSGKWNKYARDLWMNGGSDHYYNGNKNGYDYCCVFKDWCFYEAAGKDKAKATAVCPVSTLGSVVDHIKEMFPGRVDRIPARGDIVLFKDKSGLCHTGLVSVVNGDSITTIEGNVDATWHKVARKEYKLSDGYIDSFCHPYYDENDDPVDPVEKFSRGDIVKVKDGIETNYAGVKLSPWVIDGRPLYVMDSNTSCTKITVDHNLSAITATMWTEDLELVQSADDKEVKPEGDIVFINNEDSPESLEHLRSALSAADEATLDTLAQMKSVLEGLTTLRTSIQNAIDALDELD